MSRWDDEPVRSVTQFRETSRTVTEIPHHRMASTLQSLPVSMDSQGLRWQQNPLHPQETHSVAWLVSI